MLVETNEDIAAAIRFSREQHLSLTLQSGRHGQAGLATNDGGLVIDVSCLNKIEVIDADKHLVREGLNNKLKVMGRRCYGLRNVVRMFQRLTLDLEGYRWFSPWRLPTYSGVSGKS